MALVDVEVLNQPFVNGTEIYDVLKRDIPSRYNIPIYQDFPSDSEIVRYGIYVSDVHPNERTVNQLGVQYCSAIYNATDVFQITYISYQDDPYNVQVNNIIANLITSLKDDGQQLFDGYFERTFSQERTYGPTQAEKHTWTFSLVRLEFNT